MLVDLTERERTLIRDALNIQAEIALVHDLKELAQEYWSICQAMPPETIFGKQVYSKWDAQPVVVAGR